MPFSTADMKVNGLATKGKVMDNPFVGKAVTAYCAGLAVCFFHKVTLIQPEVYLRNALLDIYHIKIICEYLKKKIYPYDSRMKFFRYLCENMLISIT